MLIAVLPREQDAKLLGGLMLAKLRFRHRAATPYLA